MMLAKLIVMAMAVPASAIDVSKLDPPEPNPADPVDYAAWINETFEKHTKDNAADLYLKAFEAMEDLEGFYGDFGVTIKEPWTGNASVAAWLRANDRALSLFRLATKKPGCFFRMEKDFAEVWGTHLASRQINAEPLANFRMMCKGLAAEGFHALAEGDEHLFARNVTAILQGSHHIRKANPTLIAQSVGISCLWIGHDMLLRGMQVSDDPGALAVMLAPRLHVIDPPLDLHADVYMIERLFTLDLCQHLFEPGQEPGIWILNPQVVELTEQDTYWKPEITEAQQEEIARIGYEATLAEVSQHYEELIKWSRVPCHRALKDAEALEKRVADSRNPFVRRMLSSETNSRRWLEHTSALQRAAHLVIHLHAYKAKRGTFPDSLDVLLRTPAKPYLTDPFSGKPFVYRKDGDSFVLYSVWHDLKDDGGKHQEDWGNPESKGDYVFWPVQP